MDEEILAQQAVVTTLNGEHATIKKHKANHRTWQSALSALTDAPDPQKSWTELENQGVRYLSNLANEFPPLLREMPHAPFGIYVRGELPDTETPLVAIVGTRKASALGKRFAEELGRDLSRAGIGVVSGLAFGIDKAAHRGTLAAEHSPAIAILAGGVDDITPRSNRALGEDVISSGAIVSEYPPGENPRPHRFIARNRIISGLSRGVVVVEAPTRSGALSTARFALEQNRDVFAVPGPYNHKNYTGTHELIRQGAALVTDAEHVLEVLGLEQGQQTIPLANLSKEEQAVMNALEQHPGASKDVLGGELSFAPSELTQILSMLLLDEHITEEGGRYYLR